MQNNGAGYKIQDINKFDPLRPPCPRAEACLARRAGEAGISDLFRLWRM